jgi:hypothetical protein
MQVYEDSRRNGAGLKEQLLLSPLIIVADQERRPAADGRQVPRRKELFATPCT